MRKIIVVSVLLLFGLGSWQATLADTQIDKLKKDLPALGEALDALDKEGKKYPSVTEMWKVLQPVDGDSYVIRPPLRDPQEKRYLYIAGRVESVQNGIVVCQGRGCDDYNAYQCKWGFRYDRIRDYVPRAQSAVVVIGKIKSLLHGTTVLGAPINGVILEAVGIVDENKQFYQVGLTP